MTIVLAPTTAANDAAKAAELKKTFEEGVAASRAGNHDAAIEKFKAALADVARRASTATTTSASPSMAKKDEKQAEEAWKKALELKPDYAEALNALATLYNNQKRFDEAAAMSAKAAAAGGGGGQRRRDLQPGHHPLEPGQDRRGQGRSSKRRSRRTRTTPTRTISSAWRC